jgi:hypothetical protein
MYRLLRLFRESKLEQRAPHQLTQRIVLCMRDNWEDPEAARNLLNNNRCGKENSHDCRIHKRRDESPAKVH